MSPSPNSSSIISFLADAYGSLQARRRMMRFRLKYGFNPPPLGADLVGYSVLTDFIAAKNLLALPGDFAEIGVFFGGGTYTLAKFLQRHKSRKKIEAIDIFDPSFDATVNTNGEAMRAIYARILAGRSQYAVFCEVTRGLDNIAVLAGDSKSIKPVCKALCFGFIDGNHSPDYVINDFYLIWNRLVPGGAVAFHDYGFDLPQVTQTIDSLREKHRAEIAGFSVDDQNHIAFIERNRS